MAFKTPASTLIQVPERFSIVEPGVYRSSSPTGPQVPFLQSLGLRTIVSLTPEHPTRQLVLYARAADVDFIHLGSTLFQPLTDWRPITDEIVKTALELILDVRFHPLLVIDPLGIHQVGIVFGCLRMMQGWNFASALSEYRAHSGPTKHRYSDETYIELFDPDLINLPPNHCLPAWWCDEDNDDDGWVEMDPPPKEKKKKDKQKNKEEKAEEGEKDEIGADKSGDRTGGKEGNEKPAVDGGVNGHSGPNGVDGATDTRSGDGGVG